MEMTRTSIYISKKVLEDAKHNRLNISAICENALMSAINEEPRSHTHALHTQQDDEPIQTSRKKKDVPMSPYHERLTAVQDRMREVGAWDVETFQNGIAVRFIKELCGGDSRTINKYYSDLQTKWAIEHWAFHHVVVRLFRMPPDRLQQRFIYKLPPP